MLITELNNMNHAPCPCGKEHTFDSKIITGRGVIGKVPDEVKKTGAKKPYILSDKNTYNAAGEEVCRLLDTAGIAYYSFTFNEDRLEPDEKTVGAAFMNLPYDCDLIIAIGSGVINDTAKILSAHTGLKFIIVATAPSMDGYASNTSSVTRGGVKISLPSRCADVIVGDTDILKKAPIKMMISGVGDMLAKYISICEWRIASLICGEYYCEKIAALVRDSLKAVTESADSLLTGGEDAVAALFEALTVSSVAMNYAGLSRPASGAEHYISHIIDMRGAEFGLPVELHGIQCALGTLITLRIYEKLRNVTPCKEKALRYAESFDTQKHNIRLRNLLGRSAESLIELEKKEGKYDACKHHARLSIILEKWDEILKIIGEELPSADSVETLMTKLGLPTDISGIGVDADLLPEIFHASKDIRDKYVLPRLLWDLGIIDEFTP